jgi:hypothetical protein
MRCRALWAAGAVCVIVVGAACLAGQTRPAASGAAALTQVGYLKASNPGAYDHLGEGGILPGHTGQTLAVSGDGNTIAAGAPHEASNATGINGNQADNSAYNAGAVYVYARNGDTWAQQAYVKASNTGSGDSFGSSVALSADGNTMAVAAHWEASAATGIDGNQADNSIPQAGAVYVFTRTGTTWRQQAYLKASNTGDNSSETSDGDQFGFSLAISHDGNTLAVGAPNEDSVANGINGNQADNSAASAGAVYVFTRTGDTWTQQAYIKSDAAANVTNGDMFGFSLSLNANGNTLAAAAYDEAGSSRGINGPIDNKRGGSGAVYVFTRTGGTWSKEAYLKSSIAENGDSWGASVVLSDDGHTLAVGSADEDCLATGINPPGCDTEVEKDRGKGGGETVSTGAVAVFVRNGTTWSQQAILKASNTGEGDWFGLRLAISGDGNVLAAGAPNEDSAGQGINGKQDDESASDAGAVYVFTRSGTTWIQQAYVKAMYNEAFDQFGSTVGLTRDGRTLAVGAPGEDSNATGFNGNQRDSSVDESGAVFIFTR